MPTDLGVGSSYYNNQAVNFAVNEARDAAQGYAINGKVGAERSVIGSLANDTVGHLLGLVSSGFEKPTFKDGMYWYASTSSVGQWMTRHAYRAITFGNVVNTSQDVIDAPSGSFLLGAGSRYTENHYEQYTNWTQAHEMDHFESQNILGAYYLPLQALSQGARSLVGDRAAYLEQWPFKDLPYVF